MLRYIESKETRLYIKCLFVLPFVILAALFFHSGHKVPSLFLPPCLFHTLTGFSCPGCGCTRAVTALLRGNLLQSLCYNPTIMYCAVLYVLFILSHTAAFLSTCIIHYEKKLPSRWWKSHQQERSTLSFLSRIHGMKARPVYLYTLIYLFLIFGVLRFFVELWQRFH